MLAHAVRRVPLTVWVLLIALAPILVPTMQALSHLPLGGELPAGMHDPDSWLRLTLAHDWLMGGNWYDHTYRSNGPLELAISPWTRPMDLVIALLVKLQFMGDDLPTKIVRAALVLPLIWMAGLTLALVTITRRLTAMPHALFMLGVLLVTAPINYNYFSPGNADHHAPLSMLFCWIVALLLHHDVRRSNGLFAIGALLALMLWISPEALLIIALVYGWFGMRWLAGDTLKPLVRVATTTALLAVGAIMIERPPAEWTIRLYDSISIAQAAPLAMVALVAWLLARITSFFWIWRAVAAAVLLGFTCAAIYLLDPLFFHGPMAQVHAYIHSGFLPRIHEAKSAFEQPWLKLIGLLIQPVAALYVAFRCATQRNGIIAPAQAAALLYLMVGTLAMYLSQLRWAYYFFPLVPLVLAPFLASWLNPQHRKVDSYWPALRLRRFSERQLTARRIPLMLALLVLPCLCIMGAALLEKRSTTDISACPLAVRSLLQNGEIDAIGNGKVLTVFAPSDLSSEMMFFTKHRPIAGNYHREGQGLDTLWQAQLSTNLEDFTKALRTRKVGLVIICPDGSAPADAIIHRLHAGKLKPPAGLTPYTIKTKLKPKARPAIFLVKGASR